MTIKPEQFISKQAIEALKASSSTDTVRKAFDSLKLKMATLNEKVKSIQSKIDAYKLKKASLKTTEEKKG